MPWTALHAALGEATSDLTFDMIVRACQAGIEEATGLDWKSTLPLTATRADADRNNHQKAELVKDIAAMANSGGGLIVYGVAEAGGGSSAAADIEPVGAIKEPALQQIRQVAGALIYPPVVGLDLIPLAPTDNPAGGVLALVIPDSLARPHLVHPENQKTFEFFMAPYRHGPYTEHMVEQQLATAYRERDQAARRQAAELNHVWEQTTASLVPGPSWVVAIAVPETPHPRPREFQPGQAVAIFDEICKPAKLRGAFSSLDLARNAPTRVGLRRYQRLPTRAVSTPDVRDQSTVRGRVELHWDGTVVVATTRDTAFPGGTATATGAEIAIVDLEQVGRDLLSTVLESQRQRGFHTDYSARIGLDPVTTQTFRRSDETILGRFQPFDTSQRVPNFQPVDGTLIGSRDESDLIATAFDLITDAVNQADADLQSDPTSWPADVNR